MNPVGTAYGWLLLAGIAVSLFTWTRLARRDERLLLIYVAALLCAFIGAKLAYVFAEGWRDWPMPDRWLRLATGKSVLGALLGGYAGVEAAKLALGWGAPTGDLFALVAPLGIAIGRIGCLLHGCCLGERCAPAWYALRDSHGVARWPAVPLELAFNVAALAVFVTLRSRAGKSAGACARGTHDGESQEMSGLRPREHGCEEGFACAMRGQHFHIYLIAYGTFRFAHEFVRATPRMVFGISGYQFLSLGCVALGAIGFFRRSRSRGREGDGTLLS